MSCIQNLGNTGESNCRALMLKAKGIILVSSVNSSGVTPSIAAATPLTDTLIDASINNTNKLDRWFPIMDLKSVTNERGAAEYFTYPDGTKEFNRDGVREVTFIRPSGTAAFRDKLTTFENAAIGVYLVDEDGNLQGVINAAGDLEPIIIEPNTFNSNLIFGNDTQKVGQIKISFDFSSLISDGSLGLFEPATGVNLLRKEGLLDVNIVLGVNTVSSIPLSVNNGSGAINNLDAVTGLVAADFTLTAITGSATLGTVTEPTDGNYVVGVVGGVTSDTVTLTITKTGIETVTSSVITL